MSGTTKLIPGAEPAEGRTTPVIAADHESMLAGGGAALERNKRLCYDMYRIVLQAGRADRVSEFIRDEYIQHNPNVVSGAEALAQFIRNSRPEREIKPTIELPLVSIVAERDMVLFAFVRPERDAGGALYHTSWFDLFRIADGRIAEHWDPALLSADMLKLAQDRCPSATLICADMKELSASAPQDLISCFLYSTHYCASPAAISQTFAKVFAALAPGGLFCFDAVDKDSIANDEGHIHLVRHGERELRFQTRWSYCGQGDAMDLHISIREQQAQQQRHYHDQHRMTAVKVDALRQMLEHTGFSVTVLEHDFGRLTQWQGSTGNVIFCAAKSAS